MKRWRRLTLSLGVVFALVLPVAGGTLQSFVGQREWDGRTEAVWTFPNAANLVSLRLTPSRCQFRWSDQLLGWSEWLPFEAATPVAVTVRQEQFRWVAFVGRRLVAVAFADVPPKSDAVKSAEQPSLFPLTPMPTPVRERIRSPLTGWKREVLEDGSAVFVPTESTPTVTLLCEEILSDFTVALPVRPNGARSIGIGVCWGKEGGYLWRWVRRRDGTFWQFAIATRTEAGWELTLRHEEPAGIDPLRWHTLQVWRSGLGLWVGVDSKVFASEEGRQFGQGQIVVWVELGDNPPPFLRSAHIAHWWCATLQANMEVGLPFPALQGQWQLRANQWVLKTQEAGKEAIALLGTPELPAWWVVDVWWRGEPIGLVFGWWNEHHYCLLRLRPSPSSPKLAPMATLELVMVRGGQEQVLDRFCVWLEPARWYRLAVRLTEQQVEGFVNGLGLVRAETATRGKVGIWALSEVTLRQFWLWVGQEMLLSLVPEDAGKVHPASEQPVIAHESVSFTLPEGLPPGVPLSARLSQEPVTLFVERQGNRLVFRVEREGEIWGWAEMRLPTRLPITIRLERRDRLLLVWLEEQPVVSIPLWCDRCADGGRRGR
ncbi:MAG: hypothetical protein C4295_09675 [Candidatus Fervidibacterota bacterium]